MKKRTFTMLLVMALSLVFCVGSLALDLNQVSSIELDQKSVTIAVDAKAELKTIINPLNARPKVLYSSSNEKVATVSNKGVITGVAKGTATITAEVGDGSGLKATCKVTVKPAVAAIKLSKTEANIAVGKTLTLKATITPKGAETSVSYSSSNPTVAQVSEKGVVTAVAKGIATITVTAKDSSGVKATCHLTIDPREIGKLTVKSGGIKSGKIADKYGIRGSQINSKSIPSRSLPISISKAPKGTVCYAVIMTDPDSKPEWTHWLLTNYAKASIPENASLDKAADMVQGKNSFGHVGYGGPTPPDKTHTYVITVYALDSELSLKSGFNRGDLLKAMDGHILAQGTIKGTYAP